MRRAVIVAAVVAWVLVIGLGVLAVVSVFVAIWADPWVDDGQRWFWTAFASGFLAAFGGLGATALGWLVIDMPPPASPGVSGTDDTEENR